MHYKIFDIPLFPTFPFLLFFAQLLMATNQLTILLVEDNVEFTNRIAELIRGLPGIGDILVAGTFEETAIIFDKEKPDIILLDIHLPGKSGLELLKYIRGTERFCWILMMTNQADEYYRRLCIRAGAEYFFDKSHEFWKIPETIQNLAKHREQSPTL
ncbi:MAG TPA: response regulator [Flavisolibacter sp.]|nr:response regulator [Flavisolibacter sp.]